ncbi:MAG: helix-turn-helix domain-containing protein, partial [Actinomycetota bacterium]|nr:helix-turn-helix domain-containing protein [Actinomycetota bacterium]
MLTELSVVEQRYLAVGEVLEGAKISGVAIRYGVGRRSVHRWLLRYANEGLGALAAVHSCNRCADPPGPGRRQGGEGSVAFRPIGSASWEAIREGDLDQAVVGIGRGSIRTMDEDVSDFASLFQRFLQQMAEAGGEQGPSALRGLIDAHLGTESEGLAIVAGVFLPFDHANVQIALTHYLSQDGATHESLGLSGQARHYGSFADLLEMGRHAGVRVGKPDLVDLPIGPDDTIACVQFGVFLIARGEDRLAILMRGPDEQGSNQAVLLEVLASDPSAARKFLAEMRRLIGELNVFRG